jgi:hypothetical protein
MAASIVSRLLHSSSGRWVLAGRLAQLPSNPPPDVHALEDLSVSGCFRLTNFYPAAAVCACVSLDASSSSLTFLP